MTDSSLSIIGPAGSDDILLKRAKLARGRRKHEDRNRCRPIKSLVVARPLIGGQRSVDDNKATFEIFDPEIIRHDVDQRLQRDALVLHRPRSL